MQHDDWGVRAERWTGLHSRATTVGGVPVHYVRAESPAAGPDAPMHVLVPPMTGSASMWLDLVPPVSALGEVVSVDLPGTITGHTGAPYRRGPRPELDARFVAAFVRQLRPGRQVVLHGWSMGGLVAARAGALLPDLTRGVVLYAPALPWRRTSPLEAVGWHTLGRLAVAIGPRAAGLALRCGARRLLDAKRTALTDGGPDGRGRATPGGGIAGGDPSRVSRAQQDLWLDSLETVREHPERLAGAAVAFASATRAMFIVQGPTNQVLDSLRAPVLLLWGSEDRLVDDDSLLRHAGRAGWTSLRVAGAGHLLPVEMPDLCARTVGSWLSEQERSAHPS